MHCTSEILNCKQPSERFLSIAFCSDAFECGLSSNCGWNRKLGFFII